MVYLLILFFENQQEIYLKILINPQRLYAKHNNINYEDKVQPIIKSIFYIVS